MENRGSSSVFYSIVHLIVTVTCAYVFMQLYLAPPAGRLTTAVALVFFRLSYRTVTWAYIFTQLYLAPQLEDGQSR